MPSQRSSTTIQPVWGLSDRAGRVCIRACAVVCLSWALAPRQVQGVDLSGKGSLLIFPKVELRWNAGGVLIQDTVVRIVNDSSTNIRVQAYFVNGDPPIGALAGASAVLAGEAEPGWNWQDCQFLLSANQPTTWSAATGQDVNCQPFTFLDPGPAGQLGRPDPQVPGERMLRGHALFWAVDQDGQEIHWNHLFGSAVIVNYSHTEAWEYEGHAFKALSGTQGSTLPDPGVLNLNGVEYEAGFDTLYMDFLASAARWTGKE